MSKKYIIEVEETVFHNGKKICKVKGVPFLTLAPAVVDRLEEYREVEPAPEVQPVEAPRPCSRVHDTSNEAPSGVAYGEIEGAMQRLRSCCDTVVLLSEIIHNNDTAMMESALWLAADTANGQLDEIERAFKEGGK